MGNRRNSETVFATQKQNLPSTGGHLRAEICSRETDKYLLSILQDMLKMLYN